MHVDYLAARAGQDTDGTSLTKDLLNVGAVYRSSGQFQESMVKLPWIVQGWNCAPGEITVRGMSTLTFSPPAPVSCLCLHRPNHREAGGRSRWYSPWGQPLEAQILDLMEKIKPRITSMAVLCDDLSISSDTSINLYKFILSLTLGVSS